jgi:hypothetical protein
MEPEPRMVLEMESELSAMPRRLSASTKSSRKGQRWTQSGGNARYALQTVKEALAKVG